MRSLLAGLFWGLLVGGIAGFSAGIFVYPFWFLSDIVADERLEDRARRERVATGEFIHANPSDPIHWGRGRVSVFEDTVFLEPDFQVGPGPKYHVYLVPQAPVTPDSDVEATMFVDLGRLRAFKGSQRYDLPAGVDPRDYASVVIWCEHFAVLISPATLAPD